MKQAGCGWVVMLALLGAVSMPQQVQGQVRATEAVRDRIGVADEQVLQGRTYQLAAVHVEQDGRRVLQEYLPEGQVLGQQTDMLMIDRYDGEADPLTMAQAKLRDVLARRGQGDVVANGELLTGPDGSAAIDFVLSAPLPDGGLVVEWNAYHYRRVGNALVLTALSRRAYNDPAVTDFLKALKQQRAPDRSALLGWEPLQR